MNIFFTGSSIGNDRLSLQYKSIQNIIQSASKNKSDSASVESQSSDNTEVLVHMPKTQKEDDQHDSDQIRSIVKCDLFIVEASYSTNRIGFELGIALNQKIPVIILSYENTTDQDLSQRLLPLVVSKENNTNISINTYTDENLEQMLTGLIKDVQTFQTSDKFTLILPPQLKKYLDWIAKTKQVSRSDYVKGLIEIAAKKNTRYKAEA